MENAIINDQTNEDIFNLDRDQTNHSDERPSTPPPNHQVLYQLRAAITYEIIKTQDQHVVLVHEQPPVDTTNVENEQGIKRRFAQDNPVIPDDIFLSPISAYSCSNGYCSGCDWHTDSTWLSYDSMRDDLSTIFEAPIRSISQFILSDETAQGNRGLPQPQLSCEHCNELSAVYGEGKWE